MTRYTFSELPFAPPELAHSNYDGVCSMLAGNGEICTTIGPTGFHTAPEAATDIAHTTQHVVWAGRRGPGPQYPLLNFGSLTCNATLDGRAVVPGEWSQSLDHSLMAVRSTARSGALVQRTLSCVPLHMNALLVETEFAHCDGAEHTLDVEIALHLPAWPSSVTHSSCTDGVEIRYTYGDLMGTIRLLHAALGNTVDSRLRVENRTVRISARGVLGGQRRAVLRALVQFSDRLTYTFPLRMEQWDDLLSEHRRQWDLILRASAIHTGNPTVDACRFMGMYTLRCQLSPWSIGPTLSEPYWGGGAFHDEMYPFFALISANLPDLAARMPYFRLTTLPAALTRGRGQGALYPWSSTEDGHERDPDGLWLTERFHLAQFSAEIWSLWLYERSAAHLADLYPVLRDIARYYENAVVESVGGGVYGTMPCVDFDESVGAVRNGPFTSAGAQAALRWAAEAATILGIDTWRSQRWREIADGLAVSICTDEDPSNGGDVFGIPGGVPFHYSVLGHIFPFRTEVFSDRARRSAMLVHDKCRSSKGWKPGYSRVYDGSNWMWTAGHLGIVHAMHNRPMEAWQAIVHGTRSCGPGLIPNEHMDRRGVVHVPWFTTGVGAWIYGLHASFAWVDETATHLASALPPEPTQTVFAKIRGAYGVTVSGECAHGALQRLTVTAPRDMVWRYSLPSDVAMSASVAGRMVNHMPDGRVVMEVVLAAETPTDLITG